MYTMLETRSRLAYLSALSSGKAPVLINSLLVALLLAPFSATQVQAWFIPKPLSSLYVEYGTNGLDKTDPAGLYLLDTDTLTAESVRKLHQRRKKVMCYYSFGTAENWRSDYSQFPQAALGGLVCSSLDANGKCNGFSEGERWLDVRSSAVRQILRKRIQHVHSLGCDGLYPDNMPIYSSDLSLQPITPFSISLAANVDFAKWTAATCHSFNLSVGLVNPEGPLSRRVVSVFDWAIAESCIDQGDWSNSAWYSGKFPCDPSNLFIAQGKAVFPIVYAKPQGLSFPQGACSFSNAAGFSTRHYSMALDGKVFGSDDCLAHRPASCAPWRECRKAAVYRHYAIAGQGMQAEDMMGQCVRARQKGCYK